MKILIVNFSDSAGGASIAANRLHDCLIKNNVDSKFLVLDKKTNNPNIFAVNLFLSKLIVFFGRFENRLIRVFYSKKTTSRFSSSILSIRKINRIIDDYNPDIVHLHWVQLGMLGIKEISKIKKPIVWSLHDVWGFTGGCHYNESCINFYDSCGNCKVLGSNKSSDLSQFVFNSKMKAYTKHGNITFVGLSKWITSLAMKSPLTFNGVVNLPNPIDTNVYRQIPKNNNSFLLKINSKNNNILIGAMSLKIKRKGFNEFIDALGFVSNDFDLVTFGNSNTSSLKIKQKTVNLGFISSINQMIMIYNAVGVTVVPSLEENLSNVIMESLACGTPVVAFNIGGNSDLITHKVNGYLAIPSDVKDLAQGIDWVLNNKEELNLSQNCINKVRKEFDYSIVAKKYTNLYKKILNQ